MHYRGKQATVRKSSYQNNGRLAVLIDTEEGTDVITVNIDEDLTNKNCAFIDTNNFGESIIDWLNENNLGRLTGHIGFSGFCIYPEYEFNAEKEN